MTNDIKARAEAANLYIDDLKAEGKRLLAQLEARDKMLAKLQLRAEAVISNAFQLCRVAPDYKPNRESLWASARELDRILEGGA